MKNKKIKVLYIATTAEKRNRLDGETIKCRLLKEYLKGIEDIELLCVDTDNWKKHIFRLTFSIIKKFFVCKVIIVSSADNGSHLVLDFFRKIKTQKDIYYFVVGGSLSRNIKNKNWNIKTYNSIKCIYVEAETLKNELNNLNIDNVRILSNFRKVKSFKNLYKKTKEIKFVYYGRVIKEKGIEESIKLVKRLNKEKINCKLDIYGQCKAEYLNTISKMFEDNITYHGEIKPNNKDEYEILSQYDIFIFPTEYQGECLPGALIDCYIAGLAVIASNWKYAKEYINDGKNGYIFEYKNYEDMYNKTIRLIKSDKLEEFKEKSIELSKNYYIENILENFKKELLEDKQ